MNYKLPLPVLHGLRKLGADLKSARRRRRISTSLMAERASISRTTLVKIEKGESSVAMEKYAMVCFVIGMIDRLSDIADIRHDELAVSLEEDYLPKRIRYKKKKSPEEPKE